MIVYGTFFQSLVLLEDEKEDQAFRDCIYREEDTYDEVILTTHISPKRYGKWYEFHRKMGYSSHGPLIDSKHALIEPHESH